jgi:Phage capsid protein
MATYTNLDDEIFAQSALEAFVKVLAPLRAFSTNFSASPGTKGASVLVPVVSNLTATTFAGSYAVSNGAKTVITVSLTGHKFLSVGQDDLTAANSSASSLESFGRQQGAALATLVMQDILSLVTTANFSLATAVSSTALDVPQLRATRLLLNQNDVPVDPRSMLIDCTPYDALLGVTNFVQAQMFRDTGVLQEGKVMRALGFDFYELNNLFASGASVMGFACHPNAIAIAMRYLAPQSGNTYEAAGPVTDPETGLTLGLRKFYDNATGTRYIAMEANYGYAKGLSTGGRVLKRLD